MDTSKEYIKMCENWDLQSDRVAQVGDYYVFSIRSGKDGEPFVITKGYSSDPNYYTWLPRQDQLQEIMEKHYEDRTTKLYLHYEFHNFLESKYLNISAQNAFILLMNMFEDCSFEQLWLAFVMKEKHNALWTGEEWDRAHWTEKEVEEIVGAEN